MSIPQVDDPIALFDSWFQEAKGCKQIVDATAMSLATVDEHGAPDARIVLLKGVDLGGFVFYTNLGSVKAAQLAANPNAALVFHWAPLERQVRVRGAVHAVTPEEADAYFASRPKQSQIGAWASRQSQPYGERWELEKRLAHYTAKYGLTKVPRPDFWSGFRLMPAQIEFWLQQPYRLHDRVRYVKGEGGTWGRERLFP